MVELSMIDRERGMVTKQTIGTKIDVMHVIVQRAPKHGVNALLTYHMLIRRGPPPRPLPAWVGPRGPPQPPPKKEESEIIVIDATPKNRYKGRNSTGRSGRRSVRSSVFSSSTSESDSDSSDFTITSSSSGEYLWKGRKGRKYRPGRSSNSDDSDYSSSDEVVVARWKVDPVAIRFSQKEKGRDVVQLLLERWTPAGDGKAKEKGEEKEEREVRRKKRRSRSVIIEEDSSSLADD